VDRKATASRLYEYIASVSIQYMQYRKLSRLISQNATSRDGIASQGFKQASPSLIGVVSGTCGINLAILE
jgi:hypothetical protein